MALYVITVIYFFIVKEKDQEIKRKEILNQEKYIKEKRNVSVQAHHNSIVPSELVFCLTFTLL